MIQAVRLLNCQSIKEATLELATDKVNVISSDVNNTGKSVLFRMFRATVCPKFFNRDRRRELIRHGCEYAEIDFIMTDNAMGATRVYPNQVIYAYTPDGDNQPFTWYDQAPDAMLQSLGFTMTGGKFVPNIVDDEQDLALVDLKDGSDANLLNFMLQDERLNALADSLDEMIPDWKDRMAKLEAEILFTQNEYNKVEKIDEYALEQKIALDEAAYGVAMVFQNWLDKVVPSLAELAKRRDYNALVKMADFAVAADTALAMLRCKKLPKEPPSMELVTVIEAGERLIACCRNTPTIDPFAVEKVNALQSLEGALAALRSVKIPAPPCPEQLVQGMTALAEGLALAQKCYHCNRQAEQAEYTISQLEKAFRESGEVYDCQIYGKVVYDGKKCLPCDL